MMKFLDNIKFHKQAMCTSFNNRLIVDCFGMCKNYTFELMALQFNVFFLFTDRKKCFFYKKKRKGGWLLLGSSLKKEGKIIHLA
jgi:hypothetical protein